MSEKERRKRYNEATLLISSKINDRMITLLLAIAVTTFGRGVSEFNINRISIKRQRSKLRVEIIETLRDSFKSRAPMTVH